MLFLATGIDREASVVFVRSHVHEHVELAYLLQCTAHVGELSRMIQFREKGDQDQHVELTRDLALQFNHRYGPTFTVRGRSAPRWRHASPT
ncbi:hypothetical protein BH24ACT12_BH24ACT12_07230 [soil metagenome]